TAAPQPDDKFRLESLGQFHAGGDVLGRGILTDVFEHLRFNSGTLDRRDAARGVSRFDNPRIADHEYSPRAEFAGQFAKRFDLTGAEHNPRARIKIKWRHSAGRTKPRSHGDTEPAGKQGIQECRNGKS